MRKYAGVIETQGGTRLSAHQARPCLIDSREYIPEFFGQEISAYVLATTACGMLDEGIAWVNRGVGTYPRLAVSLVNIDGEQIEAVVEKVRSHAVFVNAPTTAMLPFYHEGNDYMLRLASEKLLLHHSPGSGVPRFVRAMLGRFGR